MPVDLRKAFVPVTNLITNQIILTVTHPDKVPSKTLPEFIAFAPARPTRRCLMRRSAMAASTTSRWSCSS